MIHSMRLVNFKKHADLLVQFDERLNVFVGPNASGKTTLLKALNFAFFGVTAAGAKEHLRRWGSKGEFYVEVDVTLPQYGRVKIYRGATKATVTVLGSGEPRIIASGQTPVSELIEVAYGQDSKTLRMLSYSPQGEAQGLLAMGATALQKKVEEISKTHVVDQVLKLVSNDLSTLEGTLSALPDTSSLEELTNKVSERTVRVKTMQVHLDLLAEDVKVLNGRAVMARQEVDAAVTADAERNRLVDQVNVINQSIQSAERDMLAMQGDLEKLPEDVEHRAKVAHEALEGMRAEAAGLQAQAYKLDALRNEILKKQDVQQQLQLKLPFHREAEDKVRDLEWQMESATKNMADAALRSTVAQGALEQAQAAVLTSACQTCKRPFDASHALHAQQQLDAAQKEAAIALTEAKQTQETFSSLSRELKEARLRLMEGIEDRYATVVAELDTLMAELDSADDPEEALSSVRHRIALAEVEARTLVKQAADRAALVKYLDDAQARQASRVNEHLQMISALSQCPEVDVAAARTVAELAEQVAADKRNNLQQGTLEVSGALRDVEALQTQVSALQQAAEKRKAAEDRKSQIVQLQKYLTSNRSRLTSDIWSGLLDYSSALLDSLTEGELSSLNRSASGDFVVKEGDQEAPVSELSGAQRSMVGLCIRVAFTKVFYGDGLFLLLDEVTADCTDVNAARVAGMLSSLNSQIGMVTHRQGDAVLGDNVVALGS